MKKLALTCLITQIIAFSVANGAEYSVDVPVGFANKHGLGSAAIPGRINIKTTPQEDQRIEDIVRKNVTMPRSDFIREYGVPPEAFVAAKIFAEKHNISYAIPSKFHGNYSQKPVGSPTGHIYHSVNNGNYGKIPLPTQWGKQWDMKENYHGIDVLGAWNYIDAMKNQVYIAIVDCGLAQYTPYDLFSKLVPKNSVNFYIDKSSGEVAINSDVYHPYTKAGIHGVHTAGTILANGPNVYGVDGPVKNISGYAIGAPMSDDPGRYFFNAWSLARIWAVGQIHSPEVEKIYNYAKDFSENKYPAKVVNNSYAVARRQVGMSQDFWVNYMLVLTCNRLSMFDKITTYNAKSVLVFAAGNEKSSIIDSLPQACPNLHEVIVEATDYKGNITSYSNYYNPKDYEKYSSILSRPAPYGVGTDKLKSIIVKAPGGGFSNIPNVGSGLIYSTTGCPTSAGSNSPTPNKNLDCYGYMAGTSMATPHVTGIIGMIYSIYPSADFFFVSKVISNSLENGIINARKAVEYTIKATSHNSNNDEGDSSNNNGVLIAGGLALVLTPAVMAILNAS